MYLCMTEVSFGQNKMICHGKAIPKCSAENGTKDSMYIKDINYSTFSWVARADTPHECNVRPCILNRIYLRNKLWDIGIKRMLYEEYERFLYTKLPRDIVIYIFEKFFCKKQIKYNN